MSNFFIPGIDNRFNTKEVRDSLVKKEKVKLEQSEEKLKKVENEKNAWNSINKKLIELNNVTKDMTASNSPFKNLIAHSSNIDALKVSALKGAKRANYSLDIIEMAKTDKFFSKPFNIDLYNLKDGDYTFSVGNEELKINHKGSINKLVNLINESKFINANLLKDSEDNHILSIESTIEGEKNKIIFKDEALKLAQDLEILSKDEVIYKPIISIEEIKNNLNVGNISYENENLILSPLSEFKIEIPKDFKIKKDLILEFKIKYEDEERKNFKEKKIKFQYGKTQLEDIVINNEESELLIGKREENPNHLNIIKFRKKGEKDYGYEKINIEKEFKKVEINLNDIKNFKEIVFENPTREIKIYLSDIKITSKNERGGYLPLNPQSFARNAKINFEGLELERDSNKIKDLIPNIELNLLKEGEKDLEIKIEYDIESIKNLISNFLIHYNELLSEVNITTANENLRENEESTLIEELNYLTKEDKDKLYEYLGLLKSEFLLINLKNELESIMFKPYITSDETISLINNIGVFTKSFTEGGGLRRYINIEPKKFNEIIESKTEAVRELFAKDSTGDNIIDEGIAKKINELISPLVSHGGTISNKILNVNNKINEQKKQVENYREILEKKEKKVNNDLNKLDGTLKEVQERSNYLKSLDFNNSK